MTEASLDHKTRAKAGQSAIRRLSQPVRGTLRLGQLLAATSAVLSIAPYVCLVALGDELFAAQQRGTTPAAEQVWRIVAVLLGTFSAQLMCHFAGLLVTHLADLRLRHRLQRDLVARLGRAPLAWFSESTSGQVRKAVQDDAISVHTVIAHGPIEMLSAVLTPLALLGYAFWLDWRLGLLAVATVPLYIATYSLSLRAMPAKTAQMDTKLGRVSATMAEFVAGILVVKAFGRVGKAHEAYLGAADEFTTFFRNWSLPLVAISCLSQAWVSIPVLLLVNLGGGALLLNTGAVTLPEVLACTLIALVLPGSIIVVSSVSWAYQLAGGAALRLCALLDTEVLPEAAASQTPQHHGVTLDRVSYSYGDTLALDDVSLTLPEGTVTALVGPSGSGKSTLATLIARFADPDSGSVLIGGVPIAELSSDTLYATVSFVLQDAQLLHASIRDNIALARPEASLHEVRRAAQAARIDEFIESLPQGYDTVLGEDTSLSGGQEQRISIARAVLANTPILLLDEATAFADPESEAEIQQALSELVQGRTVLVIAHRIGAIRGADQIVVLDHGRVRAVGSHDDLLDDEHYLALLRQNGSLEGAAK